MTRHSSFRSGTSRYPGGLPAPAPAAGVTPAQLQPFLEHGTLLKRLPTLAEVADAASSDRAGAMTATVVDLSAGSFAD